MSSEKMVLETEIPGLELIARGKVRDIYAADADSLLIVTTDRISAFDVVLPNGVPGKGKVLTALSKHWFQLLEGVVDNHLLSTEVKDFPAAAQPYADILEGRTMLVRKAKPMPVECIARGYITGSGWKDYLATGAVCGHALPEGLQEAARLEKPLFTPSTKAEQGDHDENIDFETTVKLVGQETAEWLREMTLKIYDFARVYAEERGIIIADTKMEFGRLEDGSIILIDEVLTPDASRFWNRDEWSPGSTPPSYDKQVVRNYLMTLDWDRSHPGPKLTDNIIEKAVERYEGIAARIAQKG